MVRIIGVVGRGPLLLETETFQEPVSNIGRPKNGRYTLPPVGEFCAFHSWAVQGGTTGWKAGVCIVRPIRYDAVKTTIIAPFGVKVDPYDASLELSPFGVGPWQVPALFILAGERVIYAAHLAFPRIPTWRLGGEIVKQRDYMYGGAR